MVGSLSSIGFFSSRVNEFYQALTSVLRRLAPSRWLPTAKLEGRAEPTKISSAESDLAPSELFDMAPGDFSGGGGCSRNGLRDRGLAGGSSNGEAGDAARLRNGLLDERLRLRPIGS